MNNRNVEKSDDALKLSLMLLLLSGKRCGPFSFDKLVRCVARVGCKNG
jgi:hypothetical protein